MAEKTFTILENNPVSVNKLAHSLGLSEDYAFYDVYSLTDPDLLALVPRPVYALLTIIPMTPSWNESRLAEDRGMEYYTKSGPDEPVLWFKQIIHNGCGSIGMLHCTLNSEHLSQDANMIIPGSQLEKLAKEAIPLKMAERAQSLADSDALYEAHQAAAAIGDTVPPPDAIAHRVGHHFVSFVKGRDGHLYELEGNRKGPLDRGVLNEDEDLLSAKAIQLGLKRVIDLENAEGGDLRFSCVALAPRRE